jgi:hypothetical protein
MRLMPPVPRRATALIAAIAVAFQALLATWPPAANPTSDAGWQTQVLQQDDHHPAHHAVGREPGDTGPAGPPPEDFAHHAKFCCILGSKLGTAIGPAPAPVSLPTRVAEAAQASHAATEPGTLFRPHFWPLGARAPPFVS